MTVQYDGLHEVMTTCAILRRVCMAHGRKAGAARGRPFRDRDRTTAPRRDWRGRGRAGEGQLGPVWCCLRRHTCEDRGSTPAPHEVCGTICTESRVSFHMDAGHCNQPGTRRLGSATRRGRGRAAGATPAGSGTGRPVIYGPKPRYHGLLPWRSCISTAPGIW